MRSGELGLGFPLPSPAVVEEEEDIVLPVLLRRPEQSDSEVQKSRRKQRKAAGLMTALREMLPAAGLWLWSGRARGGPVEEVPLQGCWLRPLPLPRSQAGRLRGGGTPGSPRPSPVTLGRVLHGCPSNRGTRAREPIRSRVSTEEEGIAVCNRARQPAEAC